ncbi:hypothetical protein EVAR_76910_1 [Eumeta japonica]|uniref:Uncharacterized protein n=1 Tax=Eumeta variegata TaxID=151549 RepID=A0A4C1SHH4_EUMVA|nr:hypothetical protein EVAR_76910_1 [Eumeta japonica]
MKYFLRDLSIVYAIRWIRILSGKADPSVSIIDNKSNSSSYESIETVGGLRQFRTDRRRAVALRPAVDLFRRRTLRSPRRKAGEEGGQAHAIVTVHHRRHAAISGKVPFATGFLSNPERSPRPVFVVAAQFCKLKRLTRYRYDVKITPGGKVRRRVPSIYVTTL